MGAVAWDLHLRTEHRGRMEMTAEVNGHVGHGSGQRRSGGARGVA
jgi:hypothetical protein